MIRIINYNILFIIAVNFFDKSFPLAADFPFFKFKRNSWNSGSLAVKSARAIGSFAK